MPVVHDGDADRMMAFDNKGRYIDGDHLLMLFARYLDAKAGRYHKRCFHDNRRYR